MEGREAVGHEPGAGEGLLELKRATQVPRAIGREDELRRLQSVYSTTHEFGESFGASLPVLPDEASQAAARPTFQSLQDAGRLAKPEVAEPAHEELSQFAHHRLKL
jgi:hypothetical protein